MSNELSLEEQQRYSRHIVLPEVGREGQVALKSARVLIIGAGGLGSPIALYLASAGVGTLGIVDFDAVDLTNLQRQILHSSRDIGKPKIISAQERLALMNPNVCVQTYQTKLTSENALDILKEYDIIVDGTDNFSTRYLVNDACVLLQKPNVYGSIFRFDGQVTVFDAKRGPCYRCLYPAPPPPELVPNCAEGGVMGALPGIIGSLQALEVIKLTLGIGNALIGKLLIFDGLEARFHEVHIKKNPDCPVCSENPSITALIDYDEFCQSKTAEAMTMYDITPKELKLNLDQQKEFLIVDVREPDEFQYCNIGGTLIPLGTLPMHLDSLPKDKEIVVLCHHGMRSARAANVLRSNGFANVKNLVGGIDAWSVQVDPKLPRY